jgi:hypothetical protein
VTGTKDPKRYSPEFKEKAAITVTDLSKPDAVAGWPDGIQRADPGRPGEPARRTWLPGWSRVRDNPGAATATGAIALWGTAALTAVLVMVIGGRTITHLAAHTSHGPAAGALASPSRTASPTVPARSSSASPPSPSRLAPAGMLTPAAATGTRDPCRTAA